MNITDLKNAVKEIDFDKEKQEQMILEIQAKKSPAGIQESFGWQRLQRYTF